MKKTTFFNLSKINLIPVVLAILILSTTSLFAQSNDDESESGDTSMKIRLKFNSANSFTRKITTIVKDDATTGYDSDYDESLNNLQEDDMYWLISQGKFVNQAIGEITEETILPLGVNTNSNGIHTISIDKLDNIPSDMKIFIQDAVLGIYHDIKEGPYEVNLNTGVFMNRFSITFMQPETLSLGQLNTKDNAIDVYFNSSLNQIKILNNSNSRINSVHVYSIIGQTVYSNSISNTDTQISIDTDRMTTGTYIVMVNTATEIITKKILVN